MAKVIRKGHLPSVARSRPLQGTLRGIAINRFRVYNVLNWGLLASFEPASLILKRKANRLSILELWEIKCLLLILLPRLRICVQFQCWRQHTVPNKYCIIFVLYMHLHFVSIIAEAGHKILITYLSPFGVKHTNQFIVTSTSSHRTYASLFSC